MIAAILAAVVMGGPAPAASDYPAALTREDLSAWLRQSTAIAPEQVVAVSISAATAIVARTPSPNGGTDVRLRAVALTPQAAARSGVQAWEMQLEVDCRTGQVRVGATTGYAARTASGDGISLAPADAAWRRPKPNTTIEASWRAVCDANFVPPLIAPSRRVAGAEPVKPVVTPAVAVIARNAGAEAPATTPPARPAPAARTGHAAVQVVSSPLEAETRQRLASLQRRYGEALQGVEARVEPAQVRGRTVYRGVVAGFASRSDARAFCETLKQGGQDCLAR